MMTSVEVTKRIEMRLKEERAKLEEAVTRWALDFGCSCLTIYLTLAGFIFQYWGHSQW